MGIVLWIGGVNSGLFFVRVGVVNFSVDFCGVIRLEDYSKVWS